MPVTDRPPLRRASVDMRVLLVENGTGRERNDRLAGEEPLEIRAAAPGQEAVRVAVTMRTPGNDFELADNPARYSFEPVNAFGLEDLPILGPVIFGQTWLVYLSWLCVVAVGLYVARTRPGLNLRAVGESPAAADAMGISVTRYRYLHTVAGGAFAGVGGACFSLALTPAWVDGLTAGAGWIAIALVIFVPSIATYLPQALHAESRAAATEEVNDDDKNRLEEDPAAAMKEQAEEDDKAEAAEKDDRKAKKK